METQQIKRNGGGHLDERLIASPMHSTSTPRASEVAIFPAPDERWIRPLR